MDCLHLTNRGARLRLPLVESTADVLVDALLTRSPDDRAAMLAATLDRDPLLLLWALLWVEKSTEPSPLGSLNLARRLGHDLLTYLTVGTDRTASPEDAPPPTARELAAALRESWLIAELVSELPGDDQGTDRTEARICGILSDGPKWLGLCGIEPPHVSLLETDHRIAQALAMVRGDARADEPPMVKLVRTARRMVHSPLDRHEAGIAWSGVRRRAAELRKAWLTAAPGAGQRLSELVQTLARRNELETRFDQCLETEKLEAMAELAAGAGHEINPPLAIISGRAQLFLRDEHDPERRHELAAINRQAIRVHEMIADMMLFARPEPPQPVPLDVAPWLDELATEIQIEAETRRTTLTLDLDSTPLLTVADPIQLAVAVRAVCINALEALGKGGRVAISAGRVEPQNSTDHAPGIDSIANPDNTADKTQALGIEIVIRDDGPGIATDVRRHLFDPFYSGRLAGRGLGLGLAKCWRIITNHGGSIEVDSPPEGGAVFRIRLPTTEPLDQNGESTS